jgi:hypothetical protein
LFGGFSRSEKFGTQLFRQLQDRPGELRQHLHALDGDARFRAQPLHLRGVAAVLEGVPVARLAAALTGHRRGIRFAKALDHQANADSLKRCFVTAS